MSDSESQINLGTRTREIVRSIPAPKFDPEMPVPFELINNLKKSFLLCQSIPLPLGKRASNLMPMTKMRKPSKYEDLETP